MHIALLEDDEDQSILMQAMLEDAGHKCVVYASGKNMTMALLRESYDLLILDWLVPDMNGLEVLKWVRDTLEWKVPVLFITQKEKEEDHRACFITGLLGLLAHIPRTLPGVDHFEILTGRGEVVG